ncbi:MAG: sugar phosphate isomerase/epimerase [Bacteroidetes bacterium]|nr:sugar phosphate isomerase/epimerase [Bacteroidota bacterium]
MQRRRFLELTALTAASLSAFPTMAEAFKRKSLGLQLYTVREAVAKDLEGTLHRLAAMGYTKLEIYGYNGSFFGKTAAEFNTILKNAGIKVVSSHHLSGLGMKMKGSLTDGWDKAVEDLHAIGAKYMACAYMMPNERTADNYHALPDLLNKSGEKSKAAGIQFAYHNHDFEFEKLDDTLVYDYLINKTDANLVKMEMDLYWISKAGHDPVAYFDKYPGRFPLWHVKDMAAGSGDITEVGHGTIDFDRIFAARKKAGLEQWFVEQDVSKGDIFESITASRAYLEKKGYK